MLGSHHTGTTAGLRFCFKSAPDCDLWPEIGRSGCPQLSGAGRDVRPSPPAGILDHAVPSSLTAAGLPSCSPLSVERPPTLRLMYGDDGRSAQLHLWVLDEVVRPPAESVALGQVVGTGVLWMAHLGKEEGWRVGDSRRSGWLFRAGGRAHA